MSTVINNFMCCVVIPFILDVRFVDAPAGVTQEGGHTEFLHLSSAVLVTKVLLIAPTVLMHAGRGGGWKYMYGNHIHIYFQLAHFIRIVGGGRRGAL